MKNKKVAIIGIGCRYGGNVSDPESFWKLLKNVEDGVKEVPDDRWSLDTFYDPNEEAPGKMYVKRGAFLKDSIYDFDSGFFGITPREVASLDPQQRLLLETAFEALDDSGLDMNALKKSKTGVFIGGFMLDNSFLRNYKDALKYINTHTAVSSSATLLSNRLSHAFDFLGPSVTIDTACSSSMVAIHLACQSIHKGESDLAIAGGVNVMLNPSSSIVMCKGKFLARDGRSKAFFEDADGYGRGEGSGIIVIKSLDKAIENGDAIYAVIEGTAVNQDGRTEGIALPNQDAQIQVIQDALKAGGVDASQIDYVEAHGTGTKAGDPIELGALGKVYGKNRVKELPVGSVKINIGHTEASAGVAAVIKAALMLKNAEIVPHMNLGKLSSQIPFESLNVKVPLQGESWYTNIKPRMIAINSFGYGGTNGHAILSGFNPDKKEQNPVSNLKNKLFQFTISGKTPKSLESNAKRLLNYLENQIEISLEDLAFTLTSRKTRHDMNWLIEASSVSELISLLKARIEKETFPKLFSTKSDKLVWVYTGMGPQWYGMGQQLNKGNTMFKETLDHCDRIFKSYSGYSILDEMLKNEKESQITKNHLAQASNFFIQIGVSEILRSKGIPCDAIVGHSVGEVAAAVQSKAITLEEGIKVIYHRGVLLEAIAGKGTLLAVGLGLDKARQYLKLFSQIEIATVNSPQSVTVAGTKEALTALEQMLIAEGIFAKMVRVEVAYHSSQIDPLKEKLLEAFSFVKPAAPEILLYSTVTGQKVDSAMHTGEYWWKNVRQQVYFHAATARLINEGYVNFIEIGPHPVLGGSVKEIAAVSNNSVNTFFSLKRLADENDSINLNIEEILGACPKVQLNSGLKGNVLRLPSYAWDKEYSWTEGPEVSLFRLGENKKNLFLQEKIISPEICWKTQVNRPSMAYLKDHQIGQSIVFPAAGYLESILAVLSCETPSDTFVLENIKFNRPLSFQEDEFPELYTSLTTGGEFTISSRSQGSWTNHVKGSAWVTKRFASLPAMDIKPFLNSNITDSKTRAYEYFKSIGLNYQKHFQGISFYSLQDDKIYAQLDVQGSFRDDEFIVHPTLLDSAFQALLLLHADKEPDVAYLPVGIDSVKVYGPLPASVYCVGQIVSKRERSLQGNIRLVDSVGNVLLDLKGLTCKKAEVSNQANPLQNWVYKYTFKDFEFASNQDYAHVPVIVTGDEKRYKQLAWGTEVEFMQEEALIQKQHAEFQLVYLVSLESSIQTENTVRECYKLLSILQSPIISGKLIRFLMILENALVDETNPIPAKINVNHASLVGFGRVVMTEMPDINFKIVDLHADSEAAEITKLLHSAFEEDELIWSSSGWKQGVLTREDIHFTQRSESSGRSKAQEPFKLDVIQKGKMASLSFRDFELPALKEGEIEITVAASSVNFKDVMKAMGMLNEAALENTLFGTEFGLEGAGVVGKVHETVTDFKTGDRVYFMGNGLRTKVNVHKDFVFKLSESISFHEAASFFVYFTAWASLMEAGQLEHGERVLIHAAAGGVGLSACSIAQSIGAEVYATAGTEEKRELLREMGVKYIYDSRSLNFYDEILIDTNGEGVDLVLNSLSGQALHKSLDLVRTMGRFIEIGKQDITNYESLSLTPFNKSIRFIALDLDKIAPLSPQLIRKYFGNFIESYSSGQLKPLPFEVYTLENFRDGFKKLATGSHIGKVIIDFENKDIETLPSTLEKLTFSARDSVLITGGCSGFGLRTALYFAEQGVKHLVLGSRRGTIPQEEHAVKEKIVALGTKVYEIHLDVTNKESVRKAVHFAGQNDLSCCGVIHAATVLEDSVIASLAPDAFERAFLPKALGGLLLHEETRELPLKFFVCYSSITSYTGNPGQLAYAASNSFLDGLMHERTRLGLPALSISWGSIGEVGILARNKMISTHLGHLGLTPVPPAVGLKIMGEAIRHFQNHIGVIDIDWNKWVRSVPGTWRKLSALLESKENEALTPFLARLFEEKEDQWNGLIEGEVSRIISEVTGAKLEMILPDSKLSDLGLDSIMAVELTVEFQSGLGVDMPIMEILGSGTITQLAHHSKAKILRLKTGSSAKNIEAGVIQEGNLVEHYLSKIFVERPYFSLTEIYKTGESLMARSHGYSWTDSMEMNIAESGRHLALLGSCVVSDANPSRDRHCYPVMRAEIELLSLPENMSADTPLELHAEIVSFDHLRSTCEALTTVKTRDGEAILTMPIIYHIIHETALYHMFEPYVNTDLKWQDANSEIYEEAVSIEISRLSEHEYKFIIEELQPDQCVGHFKDLPAFPVSVMTRMAGKLILEAHNAEFGDQELVFSDGLCQTENFAFAGERIEFTATLTGNSDERIHWFCKVEAGDKPVAKFDYYFRKENRKPSGTIDASLVTGASVS